MHTTWSLERVLAGLALTLLCSGASAQRGNGNGNSGGSEPSINQRIDAALTAPDPDLTAATAATGWLQSDGNPVYSDAENKVHCDVGDRRNIGLVFDKNPPRRLVLLLGTELAPYDGDPDGLVLGDPPVGLVGAPGIPRPDSGPDGVPGTSDDGEIADVEFRIAYRENVAALGAFPHLDEWPPNYCDASGEPIDDSLVDPMYPETYSRMCTMVRFRFQVAGHQWTLFFGPPNRRTSSFFQKSNPSAGGVVVERDFGLPSPFQGPAPDPFATNPPWEIRAMPWDTNDPAHPRAGMVVGFLHYGGTKNNDPLRYAGAFEIRWANTDPVRWTVNPL